MLDKVLIWEKRLCTALVTKNGGAQKNMWRIRKDNILYVCGMLKKETYTHTERER